ncbi:hypothetical protein XaC1_475 [Xanthomonas phage XaC1]|nr:hypothetical protein XaC1_475 [Xanthomonas phage XaC1]
MTRRQEKIGFPKRARLEGWGVLVTKSTDTNFSFTGKPSEKYKPILHGEPMSKILRSGIMNQINELKTLSLDAVLMQLVPAMLVKSIQVSLECAEEIVEHFPEVSLVRVEKIHASMSTLINCVKEYRNTLGSTYTKLNTKKEINWQSFIVFPVVVH